MPDVASYMDAWIEIIQHIPICLSKLVASYMDAWIEIKYTNGCAYGIESHPIWMRGLKLFSAVQP